MKTIVYKGIKTNNLKNIDIKIKQNSIQLLQGASGSGKSSLAIDTIYKISEDELYQLLNIKEDISKYIVEDYSNILPSVCLKQENYNTNPRSTIATYFNLNSFFKELFSRENMVSSRTFSFNINEFSCEKCNGLGVELKPDFFKIVDYSSSLRNIPFKPWRNSKKNYYKQLIQIFSESNNIDIDLIFSDLTQQQQELFLLGISQEKYKIKYNSQGRNHVKTAKYIGPITFFREELKKGKLSKVYLNYCSYQTCEECNGGRFNSSVLQYKLFDKSIKDLYLMEIEELLIWLKKYENELIEKKINLKSYYNVCNFLENIIFLKLPYLTLNRSIPSLSGGELQRLRLGKAITSHFFNFLYILDEPTSGLHPSEWGLISKIIQDLKQNMNTVLLIEHNPSIEKIADSIIYLGPEGGNKGGEIIKNHNKKIQSNLNKIKFFPYKSFFSINNASSNNINKLSINLPLNTFVGICGVSGSGKTSLIKNILPKYLKNSIYLNQSPINGNAYSIVATALGIMTHIQNLFSKKCNKPKEYFTYSSKGKGQCELCQGKGVLKELSSNSNYEIICPDCNGKRFSEKSLKFKYKGYNIYDFLKLDINSIINILEDSKITSVLTLANDIGLSYLSLFQNTSNLSGGEAQRVKFLNTIFKTKNKRIFLLDEPFRGVDEANAKKMINCLYDFIEKGYSIFIVEHNPNILKYTSYIIEFGPSGGNKGGKIIFQGKLSDIKNNENSIMKKYL